MKKILTALFFTILLISTSSHARKDWNETKCTIDVRIDDFHFRKDFELYECRHSRFPWSNTSSKTVTNIKVPVPDISDHLGFSFRFISQSTVKTRATNKLSSLFMDDRLIEVQINNGPYNLYQKTFKYTQEDLFKDFDTTTFADDVIELSDETFALGTGPSSRTDRVGLYKKLIFNNNCKLLMEICILFAINISPYMRKYH